MFLLPFAGSASNLTPTSYDRDVFLKAHICLDTYGHGREARQIQRADKRNDQPSPRKGGSMSREGSRRTPAAPPLASPLSVLGLALPPAHVKVQFGRSFVPSNELRSSSRWSSLTVLDLRRRPTPHTPSTAWRSAAGALAKADRSKVVPHIGDDAASSLALTFSLTSSTCSSSHSMHRCWSSTHTYSIHSHAYILLYTHCTT